MPSSASRTFSQSSGETSVSSAVRRLCFLFPDSRSPGFRGPQSVLTYFFWRKVPRALDVLTAEDLLGPKLIMRPTTNPKVFGIVAATETFRLDVVELQEGLHLAPTSVRRDVRAANTVAL